MFADDVKRRSYVLSWRLTACARLIAHLIGSTTRMWPLYDPKTCLTETRYHKDDMKPNLEHPTYDLAQNRNGSIHLKRRQKVDQK